MFLIFASLAIFLFLLYRIFKSTLPQTRKKFYFSLVSTFLIFVLTYSFFEAYFRYVYDESDGLGFLKVDNRWHQRHVVYNSYFFRDRDFEPIKKEQITRIGVLGDSIALGGGIKDVNNRFSNLLEKKLRDVGKNVEVYNLGKSGYDTYGEVKVYENVQGLGFDILVWEYFINDVQPPQSTGTPILQRNSQKGKIITFFSDRSFFFDYVYWRLSAKYQKTFQELKTADIAQYSNDQVITNHKKDIKNFIEILKKDNTKIVVIIFPSIFLLGSDYPSNIHQMMREYFNENGVDATIDLLADLKDMNKKELMASRFDPHPNEFVHKIAAERIFDQIMPLLK